MSIWEEFNRKSCKHQILTYRKPKLILIYNQSKKAVLISIFRNLITPHLTWISNKSRNSTLITTFHLIGVKHPTLLFRSLQISLLMLICRTFKSFQPLILNLIFKNKKPLSSILISNHRKFNLLISNSISNQVMFKCPDLKVKEVT